MKRLLIILILSLSFFSCQSTYFFSSLKTTNQYMEKTENGNFRLENDSMWISYRFEGRDAPIQITVFNKMSKPLYVDWEQSALIIDDVAYSYAGEQSWSNAQISEIAPNRLVHHNAMSLNVTFNDMKRKGFKNRKLVNNKGEVVEIKRMDFTEDNSPLFFSSYLVTYTNRDNPITYKQDFYISNLIKTKSVNPDNLPVGMANRGDLFYVEKPANTSFIEGLLGVTIAVGAIALEVALDSSE